ncbi:retropepsin-like aspartic protease family protein [Pseudomonas segetis]|uniref:Aspartyl protease family protein n=1 Tax=Pseudomonas segetis TaxID=298908 RepID=A0A239H7M2_9PSED|nr:TIGR02281 family clan AA aspartic protease [Pseudomonas segetis]SNS77038.1 aspartyl protease family protein [Pseudomonas segetis]
MKILCFSVLLAFASLAWAAPQIQVVGLFPGAAVLNVDGQRKLVKVGQTGPGGVQVVSANARGAVLRVDGVERNYSLSRDYSQGMAAPQKRSLSIAKGESGHYWVAGSVNGHPIQFLVDTGATSVALTGAQADRLGIDYRATGREIRVSTANGVARGWRINLDSVKVGTIEVRGVEGTVMDVGTGGEALLGMSFLGRVGWKVDQDVLVLESKH